MTQEAAIGRCRSLIEDSLGWGDTASWTNDDFSTLSERLFEETGVRLSVSTLKRVWGKVKYDSSPTLATLNTLARYAGFEGWRDFLQRSNQPAAAAPTPPPPAPETTPTPTPPPPAQTPEPKPKPARRSYTTPIIIISSTIIAVVSLLSARLIHHNSTVIGPPRFDARRTSDQLPNSVVFDYDATSFHPHSVIIQQSWDTRRRESVNPDGKQHTSLYYSPGYFRAKLIVDNEIKMQTDVFVPSGGWKGIVQKDPIPIYLKADEIKHDSLTSGGAPGRVVGITTATLHDKLGTDVFSGHWVDFCNIRPFPASPATSSRWRPQSAIPPLSRNVSAGKFRSSYSANSAPSSSRSATKAAFPISVSTPAIQASAAKTTTSAPSAATSPSGSGSNAQVDHGQFGIQLNGKTIFQKKRSLR
ncbi:hypothetical protein ACQ86N_47840 [Puia sp. P3]|uniref:hypothetical protein n=1 Tax=Puia sp. P3 TaxID=3423952 RepID=UPI003D6731D3